jgi:hypothetical protein
MDTTAISYISGVQTGSFSTKLSAKYGPGCSFNSKMANVSNNYYVPRYNQLGGVNAVSGNVNVRCRMLTGKADITNAGLGSNGFF